MSEAMVIENTPKRVAFMNKPYANEDRIKRDEDELAELLEARKEPVVKEVVEEEPASAEERTFKKRYGDLRRHTQQKEQELLKRIEELEAKSAASTSVTVPKSDDELETWMKDNPELASIIETLASKKAAEQSATLSSRFEELDQRERDTLVARAEQELLSFHPDIDEIRDSDEFHDWAGEQPKWVQDALYENDTDAKAAARAIDLYKADQAKKSKPKTKKSADAKAATLVGKGNRNSPAETGEGGFSESQVEAMSVAEYEKHKEAIHDSMRKNTFVYDISGGAR